MGVLVILFIGFYFIIRDMSTEEMEDKSPRWEDLDE